MQLIRQLVPNSNNMWKKGVLVRNAGTDKVLAAVDLLL